MVSGGSVVQIVEASGDGQGHLLDFPQAVAVTADGSDVYVGGLFGSVVFRIGPPAVPASSSGIRLLLVLLVVLAGARSLRGRETIRIGPRAENGA